MVIRVASLQSASIALTAWSLAASLVFRWLVDEGLARDVKIFVVVDAILLLGSSVPSPTKFR